MRFEKTYKIRYDGGTKSAWLPVGRGYDGFRDVTQVEEIPVVIADDGMTLFARGEEIGPFAVRKFDPGEYMEIPLPEEQEDADND